MLTFIENYIIFSLLFSDPYLGYTLVQPVIHGIQSQKVVANAKHYAMNNQETNVSLLFSLKI